MKYPNLFKPIQIGRLQLRNRICLAPMSFTYYSPDGGFSDENIAYVEAIARGGTGLITIGETIVGNSFGRTHDHILQLGNSETWPRIHRIAEAAHRYGAAISIEISHGGMLADPRYNCGQNPIGPSRLPQYMLDHPETLMMSGSAELVKYSQVIEMDEEMMHAVADDFAAAAALLQDLGFDMVQIHLGHGWLLHQFLSPLFNRRGDRYGGSLENRVQFPGMVFRRIRERVGRFPLDARISGDDIVAGGNTADDAAGIAALLEPYLDTISISCGGIYHPEAVQRMSPHLWLPRGVNVHLAERIKKAVSIPVNTVGGLGDPAMLEEIIASGRADLVTMGRALIADHDFANKARSGKDGEITVCLRCNNCQTGMFGEPGRRIRCSVNPLVGVEYLYPAAPPLCAAPKHLLVIGGGPAGLKAALTAAEIGHQVTLVEKEGALGGALGFSDYVPFKADVRLFRDRLISKVLAHPNISVQLNTCADAEMICASACDAVICAIGADTLVPPIPGVGEHSGRVFKGRLIYGLEDRLGQRAVIIGGGLVGCETAVYMAGRGIKTTIVEMLPDLAAEAPGGYRMGLLGQLADKVTCITGAKCTAITDTGVLVEKDGNALAIEADAVILAAGMRAPNETVAGLGAVSPVFMQIGDCRQPGKILEAVRDGYFAGLSIGDI